MARRLNALLIAASLAIGLSPAIAAAPVYAKSGEPVKQSVAVGKGGAVASVNLLATAEGTRVLRDGGNAVDAAVAAAAVLGVAEPFASGIGGGGFMVIYDARHHRVSTSDSRGTAPEAYRADVFIDPATGKPVPFPELVTSGLGVGVPGTLEAWKVAAEKFGTRPLASLLKPAIQIADQGFVVNPTFNLQINQNLSRFQDFSSTRALYLPSGAAPAVGSLFRNAYLADPDVIDIPLAGLLSKQFAAQRRALIAPTAATSPVAPGNPYPFQHAASANNGESREGVSTTHLTVADRWGNIVSYTFTIEQIGGSGMVVPGRGFLLNNELTDFDPTPGLANSPGPGKRPRSSMSPSIVFSGGRPVLALGSPGGSTIITTVLQLLINQVDFGMSLPDAIAAPRASQRNTALTTAEPAFLSSPEAAGLHALGQKFTSTDEIGAATGIAFLRGGLFQATAEPGRRAR